MFKKIQETPGVAFKNSSKIIAMILNQIASELKNKKIQFRDNNQKNLSGRFLKISKKKASNNNRNKGSLSMEKYMGSDKILMRLKRPY